MSNISVKMIEWIKTPLESRLEFNITGVNHTVVNTFRRIILSIIPTYSFNNIIITTNSSVFNNNYMKLRIRNMAVLGIHSDEMIYVPPVQIEKDDTNELEIDILNEQKDVNSNSLKLLTMYINHTNETNNIITIGTNDCQFYLAEKQIKSPYDINIPIIKLQPTQQFKASAITELGIENISSIFSAVAIFTYKMINEKEYIVMFESRGQLNEKQIMQYAYENIKKLLNDFLNLIPDKNDIVGKLLMNNADHTIGNLIADGLVKHKKVKFAGYNSPHLLDTKIMFHYELIEETNIKEIMTEIVSHYIDVFEQINKLIKQNIN